MDKRKCEDRVKQLDQLAAEIGAEIRQLAGKDFPAIGATVRQIRVEEVGRKQLFHSAAKNHDVLLEDVTIGMLSAVLRHNYSNYDTLLVELRERGILKYCSIEVRLYLSVIVNQHLFGDTCGVAPRRSTLKIDKRFDIDRIRNSIHFDHSTQHYLQKLLGLQPNDDELCHLLALVLSVPDVLDAANQTLEVGRTNPDDMR